MNAMELTAKERIEERKLTGRQRPDADLVPLSISGHGLSVVHSAVGQRQRLIGMRVSPVGPPTEMGRLRASATRSTHAW